MIITEPDSKPMPEPATGVINSPKPDHPTPIPDWEGAGNWANRMGRIWKETEGFAFFAWHRLRWPGPYFVNHDADIPYSCQLVGPDHVLACKVLWESTGDR